MKILVYFAPNSRFDNFEGARLRKTIKGALEMNSIEHTSNILDTYNLIHLISFNDEKIVEDAKEYHIPVVVSALYTEDDPSSSYLEETIKDGVKTLSIKQKALRFLNKVDHILVPCEEAKSILIKEGVETPITIQHAGVNMARFDFSRDDEKRIFSRYYREDPNKKLVVGIGEYDPNMNGINSFITAAKKCPDVVFYYVGRINKRASFSIKLKKFIKGTPSNVHFVTNMPDDVYRSALLNADIFMIPGYRKSGVISINEAMAAKCQIIARKSSCFSTILKDGETALIGEFSETLSSLAKDYIEGKVKPTINKAYDEVSKYTLLRYGDELKEIYQSLINKVGGKNYDRH